MIGALAGLSDAALLLGWAVVLGAGLAAVTSLHGLGLARTHARDLLHVGAGIWVLGWPLWSGPAVPTAVVIAVAAAVAVAPRARGRVPAVAAFVRAVSDDDERYSGLVAYTSAYAALTPLAWIGPMPAAGAALLALSWGDGIGGAVGRRWGRITYRAPGAKRKSLEGSVVGGLAAAAGGAAVGLAAAPIALMAAVAALSEAAAPRGTDNAIVPAAVWLALIAAQGLGLALTPGGAT
jgi:dolichol kinase